MGAFVMDFFRVLAEATRNVGAWAATSFRGLMETFYGLLLVSLVWLILSVAIGVRFHGIMPWMGIVYLPLIFMLLMSARTINAAGAALGVDLILNRIRGRIHFHLPTHPNGMIEYTGTGTLEDLAFLRFLVQAALTIITSMMLSIFILAALPVWPNIYITGMIILALLTWGLISLNWNQYYRISGFAIGSLLLVAILGALLPRLAHVQKIQSEAAFVNETRAIANKHEDQLRTAAQDELTKTYTKIAELQKKRMQDELSAADAATLDSLVKKRDRILDSTSVNPQTSSTNRSLTPTGWDRMTWENRIVWTLGWILPLLAFLAFIGAVIWMWRTIAVPAVVYAAAAAQTPPQPPTAPAPAGAVAQAQAATTPPAAAKRKEFMDHVRTLFGFVLAISAILALLVFGQHFWNQIANMSDLPKVLLLGLSIAIPVALVSGFMANDNKRIAWGLTLIGVAMFVYIMGSHNYFDSDKMFKWKMDAVSRMESYAEPDHKPRSKHVFATTQATPSEREYINLSTLTSNRRWHNTKVIPKTTQTLVISGYRGQILGTDIFFTNPAGHLGFQQVGQIVDPGNPGQIVVRMNGIPYLMDGDRIEVRSDTPIEISVNAFPLTGGLYYRFE